MWVDAGYMMEGTMPLCAQSTWQEESYYATLDFGYSEEYKFPPMLNTEDAHKYIPLPDTMSYDHTPLTAVGKSTPLLEAFTGKWEESKTPKPMKQWTPNEVVDWLCEEVRKSNLAYERIQLRNFHVDGCTLSRMTEQEFVERDTMFGYFLFNAVEARKNNEYPEYPNQRHKNEEILPPFDNLKTKLPPTQDLNAESVLTDLSERTEYHPGNSDIDSDQSENSTHDVKTIKCEENVRPVGRGKPGRPPKPNRCRKGGKEKKCGRLWEFIRDLLLKPEYCPSLICWENHEEGIFRFVRSDKVAELWGTIKENPKMTYEKLSRAMRYYYKSKVLQPVLGRRLVYKFGPTARGWQTNNPNFRDTTK